MEHSDHAARRQAERLARTHAELTALLRQVLARPGAAAEWNGQHHARSEASRAAPAALTISAAELHTLLRAAVPPSASDYPARRAHGLVVVCMDVARRALAALTSASVPASTVAAMQLLHDQVRAWLALNNVIVMRAEDRASAPLLSRAREPAALRGRRIWPEQGREAPSTGRRAEMP